MAGAHRRAIELKQAAALESTIDNGLSQVLVVQDATPCGQGFVGG
jgi:hypothetical protein